MSAPLAKSTPSGFGQSAVVPPIPYNGEVVREAVSDSFAVAANGHARDAMELRREMRPHLHRLSTSAALTLPKPKALDST
jgi:hypothetical protein